MVPNSPKNRNNLDFKLEELIQHNRQLILTGAPGTGKTFMAKKLSGHLVGEDGKPYQHGFFLHEEKGIVMDAKYKSGWEQGYVVDDLHQIFSYMFLKGNHHGGVIYPVPHNSFHQAAKSESIATELQVHHGPYRFHRLPFVILSTSQTMADFLKGMKDSINGWNEKYTSQVQNKP